MTGCILYQLKVLSVKLGGVMDVSEFRGGGGVSKLITFFNI